jgi:hypothetical protein
MFLSLLLLIAPKVGLSCGTAVGKHFDGVEGLVEDVTALVFLRFFEWKVLMLHLHFFSFPSSLPHILH